jgi:hypothetical protein
VSAVIRTSNGVSHGALEYSGRSSNLETACGLVFASWTYGGVRQGRRNRRRSAAQIPESGTGDVDCMTCLVLAARP